MKIIVIGNSGSGKTWLSRQLAVRHGLDVVIHLDDIFWTPGGFDRPRSGVEVSRLIAQNTANKNSWVVEGVFGDLASRYIQKANMLVWLDIDWAVCEARLQRRGSESHAGQADGGAAAAKLLLWASAYSRRGGDCSLSAHARLYDGFSGSRYHLQSEQAVAEFSGTAVSG